MTAPDAPPPASPPADRPTRRRWLLIGGMVVFLLFFTCIGPIWVVEVPIHLIAGWIFHSVRVLPEVRINGAAIGLFAVALPITALLAHHCARWLWTGIGNTSRWRWKWTLLSLTAVFLMFVAGIAATGVVHQAGWLIDSRRPLVKGPFRVSERIRCNSNLKEIGRYLLEHRAVHPDQPPRDIVEVARIVAAAGGKSVLFACWSDEEVYEARGTESAPWPELIVQRRHCSYRFCTMPRPGPDGRGRVILFEHPSNHEGEGMNLLYDDGTVHWFNQYDIEHWLTDQEAATHPAGRIQN